jgi:DNA-binding MarR family transcriptional regulator
VLTRQGLTQREYEDLLVVAAHPKSQLGEVALEMDRSDAQTGRGLKKLGEREWVVLEQEARDKRRTRVDVTAAGRQLLEDCESAKKQLTAALGSSLKPKERKRLLAGLQDVNRVARMVAEETLLDGLLLGGREIKTRKRTGRQKRYKKKGAGGMRIGGSAGVEVRG